jgi:hypothetical protein
VCDENRGLSLSAGVRMRRGRTVAPPPPETSLGAGRRVRLRLKLPRRVLRSLRRTSATSGGLAATITAVAVDQAGNKRTANLAIRLVR